MGLPQGAEAWESLAVDALEAFVSVRGAVIWPEVEACLGEGTWVHEHFDPTFPRDKGIDSHHLGTARRALEATGTIVERKATLQKRAVSAWLDGAGLDSRRKTAIERRAAAKRRLYRSYLGWTSKESLCGGVAEQIVDASLRTIAGEYLVIPKSARRGQVRAIEGRKLNVGGPLDAAGSWLIDPERPSLGLLPFAIEVKNVRSTLYPWHQETWDLLAKLGDFPDVVPILVARRVHYTTFSFFKDIGALAFPMRRQWFSSSIDEATFEKVTQEFGFRDAVQTTQASQPHEPLVRFFTTTLYKKIRSRSLMETQAGRWQQAAPVVELFTDLRDRLDPQVRRQRWDKFCQEINDAGLYDTGGWASHEISP